MGEPIKELQFAYDQWGNRISRSRIPAGGTEAVLEATYRYDGLNRRLGNWNSLIRRLRVLVDRGARTRVLCRLARCRTIKAHKDGQGAVGESRNQCSGNTKGGPNSTLTVAVD